MWKPVQLSNPRSPADGSLFSQRSFARYDMAGQRHRSGDFSPLAAWLARYHVADIMIATGALGVIVCLVWLVVLLCKQFV